MRQIGRGWRKVLVCRLSSSSGEMEVVEVGWDDEEINECILHTEQYIQTLHSLGEGGGGKKRDIDMDTS